MRPNLMVSFLCFWTVLMAARSCPAALLVDDCERDSPANNLGGSWSSYHDPASAATPVPFAYSPGGFHSAGCARLDYELKAGSPYPYAGFNTTFNPQDLTGFEGVRFYAKGSGSWSCQVPLVATGTEYNHYSAVLDVDDQWTLIEVPFSTLSQTWGTKRPWDPSTVTGVGWSASGPPGSKGWLCVDDIEFYRKEEARNKPPETNPIVREPKVNQQGYPIWAEKYFFLTAVNGGVKQGDVYRILDQLGKPVYNGTFRTAAVDDSASSGETVFRADFSDLNRPGTYIIEVGNLKSVPFEIGDSTYLSLARDALRCFTLIRCGTAVDDPLTGIKHPACHLQDAPFKEAPDQRRDLTGGWHNACDYGKWVVEESISCAWMMWLDILKGGGHSIPGPGKPPKPSALLEEARWGLDWILKMQEPDGSVRHKVDAEDHFSTSPPDRDPFPRWAQKATSIDAADAVGVFCLASRAFQEYDPVFSAKCLAAAKLSWGWLEKNPNVVEWDPDYADMDPSQEELWALGEMASVTVDPALMDRFKQAATLAMMKRVSWMEPQFFGYMALCFRPGAGPGDNDWILGEMRNYCDRLAGACESNGYGVCTPANEYDWESNENLLHKTAALLVCHAATGEERYRRAALRNMNWLLGANSLDFSFVTGHGARSAVNPWHWTSTILGKLMPGWAMGGPNHNTTGADLLLTALIQRGTPPAKCYVDANNPNGSWASNEGETSENAALVFDAGYLSEGPGR